MDSTVFAMFFVAAAIMIGLPLVVGYFFSKKFKASWKVFGWGALGFVAVQVLHAPLVMAIQNPMGVSLEAAFGLAGALVAYSIVLGLLAGLFEEIGKYLIMNWKKKQWSLDVKKVLMFGAGWGGIESILLGLTLLLTAFAYSSAAPLTPAYFTELNASMNGTLTASDVATLEKSNAQLMSLTPFDLVPAPFERMCTLIIQIAMTLLAGLAIIQNDKKLLVFAVGVHTVLDALAVWMGTSLGIWPTEAMVFLFAIGGLWLIKKNWPRK